MSSQIRNPDLDALQAQLGDILESLSAQLNVASDAPTIQALSREIVEVNHRITMVGALIFKAQTAKITQAANQVAAAKDTVEAAIQQTAKLTAMIKAVTSFLGLVDKVLDLAKLV